MMTAVMTHVVLALGVAAVAALVVVTLIAIAIATSRGRQPAPKTIRTPGIARARGTTAQRQEGDQDGLHLLNLE